MSGPYINKGKHVYVNPTVPVDGGVMMDAAIAIPPEDGLTINGAPVIEQDHEIVLRKKPKQNAPNR